MGTDSKEELSFAKPVKSEDLKLTDSPSKLKSIVTKKEKWLHVPKPVIR